MCEIASPISPGHQGNYGSKKYNRCNCDDDHDPYYQYTPHSCILILVEIDKSNIIWLIFSDCREYIQGTFTGGDCYIFINFIGSENHVVDHRAVDDVQAAVHKQLSELRDEVQKLTKAISARGGNFLEGWQNDAADTAAHAMKYSKAEVSDVGDSIRKHPTATAAIVLTVVAID